jgi:hypothetical protein
LPPEFRRKVLDLVEADRLLTALEDLLARVPWGGERGLADGAVKRRPARFGAALGARLVLVP